MSLIVQALAAGTLIIDILIVLGGLVYAAKRIFGFEWPENIQKIVEKLRVYSIEISLGLAVIATAGSLCLSNFLKWEPCRLCWFQRIFMYPIAVISGSALFLGNSDLKDYAMPLALIGAPMALYHGVIQRFEQFTSAGCSVTAVSCSTEYTFHYGYITIPVMALTAFLVIIFVLWRFED
jgi:disulfide bond formation protein DsbB